MNRIRKIALVIFVLVTILFIVSPVYLYLNPEPRTLNPFWTPDQQAQRLFDRGDYPEASALFTDLLHRGIALYAAEDFDGAVGQFVQLETAQGYFNLGNVYCHLERIPEAITAYEQALARQPDYPDAQFNLEFAQLLLPPERPDDARENGDAHFEPDEIRFDNTENKGQSTEVEMVQLSDDQIKLFPVDTLFDRGQAVAA
jgi:Ca-activated chloride channel family protein